MKEQKVVIPNDDNEINGYIDRGWIVVNMIPMMVSTGNNSFYNGKVCFLLEKEKNY